MTTATPETLPGAMPAATSASSPRGSLPTYLPWLDVLRFLACFLVILLHTLPGSPAGLGHAGVALFFSISGFLIGRVLIENQGLSRFYARRFLRIYPAYLATLVLFAAMSMTPLLHQPEAKHLFWKNIGYYLTFTFQLSPDDNLPIMIVWSLCVEELFYLLLPLLFLLGSTLRIAAALVLVIGLLLVPHYYLLPNGGGTWYLFPLNLFFGVLLALSRPRLRSWLPLVAVGCVALILINAFTAWFHSFGPVSALLCTASVWSLAVYDGPMLRLFEPLRWMGKLSYGMYLLHLFCLSFALRAIRPLEGHGALYYAVAIVLTTALTVLASWLLQVGVEDPALRLRPLLKRRPVMQYALATVQVSLIPIGILMAWFARAHHS